MNTKPSQTRHGLGEKPFTAGFVNRWLARIHHDRAQPLLARGDCRCYPCWSAAHNHHVRPQGQFGLAFHQRNRTSSAQKPGPIAARMLIVPGAGRLCM